MNFGVFSSVFSLSNVLASFGKLEALVAITRQAAIDSACRSYATSSDSEKLTVAQGVSAVKTTTCVTEFD